MSICKPQNKNCYTDMISNWLSYLYMLPIGKGILRKFSCFKLSWNKKLKFWFDRALPIQPRIEWQ